MRMSFPGRIKPGLHDALPTIVMKAGLTVSAYSDMYISYQGMHHNQKEAGGVPVRTVFKPLSRERRKEAMSEAGVLDKTYNTIITGMVATGRAPHYTEIAEAIEVPVEEARKALHDLMSAGIPGMWLFPETDYISSFAPFSNLPTQYRITVGGEQKWFGQ